MLCLSAKGLSKDNVMKSFVEHAQIYATYHQNPTTQYTHFAGVPILILSFMIFLGFIKIVVPGIYETNFACIATLGILIYYFRLHWQLALCITPIMIILLWLASWFNHYGPTKLGVWAFVITFIVGWGLQLYGHFVEGKRPAFMVNLSQALIAPLYLMAELFFMAGYMKPLQEEIHGSIDGNPL